MFIFQGVGEGVLLKLPDGNMVRVTILPKQHGNVRVGIDAPPAIGIVRITETHTARLSRVYEGEE